MFQFKAGFLVKTPIKSLLPEETYDREALTHQSLNIKPRFSEGLQRLKNIFPKLTCAGLTVLFLMGYFPAFSFPPQPKIASAAVENKQEIITSSLPEPFSLPVPGYISTHFSSYHPGADIATGLGMPIHPITSGTVEEVNYGFLGYGNHVIISHPGGFKSLYAHMGRVFVKKGQDVAQTTILGEVGLTGHTSGPHTHLEVTYNGKAIDPMTILPELPDFPKSDYLPPAGGPIATPSNLPNNLHKGLKPDFN